MTIPKLSARVEGLFVGKSELLWPDKAPSAIRKIAIAGPLRLSAAGFDVDTQADLEVHGGVGKAVHHYAADHYSRWTEELGDHPDCFRPGGFGENISTHGLTESDVFIGDIFEMGSAIVQVSQGRQPCWKLNLHTGISKMAQHFQRTGRTGWYYRVIESGTVAVGDTIRLTLRPNPTWSVQTVTRARLGGRIDPGVAAELSALVELNEGWRRAFAKKVSADHEEDVSERLGES